MKLLLVVASLADINPYLDEQNVSVVQHAGMKFLYSCKLLHHEVDLVETGAGLHQTTYKVTKAISAQKYHLALKLSFGAAYKEDIAAGTILNVVNEKPADMGTFINAQWQDLYDLNLLNREQEPHVRGGHINLTNAYMNVFLPFKKSVGLTVNHYADTALLTARREKYKADCETTDGLGFVYPCLFEKQSIYHLCVIERNLVTGEENFNLAKEKLNETLKDLIQKL